jgi:hypothetical protein
MAFPRQKWLLELAAVLHLYINLNFYDVIEKVLKMYVMFTIQSIMKGSQKVKFRILLSPNNFAW